MIQPSTIEQARNELQGLIADAATRQATGGELSLKLRYAFQRVETILAVLANEAAGVLPLKPAPPPPVNGTPTKPPMPSPANTPRKA